MPIQAPTARVSFACNGATTAFPVNIQSYNASDFLVLLSNNSTGQAATLALGGDYSLTTSGSLSPTFWTLNTLAGQFSSPYAAGFTLQVILNPAETQLSQFTQGQSFPSLAVQTALDRSVQMIIREGDILNRAIIAPDTDVNPVMLLPAASVRKLTNLGFDASGNLALSLQLIGTNLSAASIAQFVYVQDNVLLHGADSTGFGDSLAAFNAATSANTDFVSIPPGTYRLSANTNLGLWEIAAGVTFTGPGLLTGKAIQRVATSGNYMLRLLSSFETSPSQVIGFNIEQGLYQPGTVSALQFGQATELFTPSTSAAIWNGQLNSVYGSVSHFGSGAVNFQVGGAFESFNDGSATVVAGVGVNGNAWNGGVAAGNPVQTPTNNGIVQNLRGVSGFCGNLSTGTVTTASSLFASTINNTGGGAITNAVGLTVGDQTAGTNNFGVLTGLGLNQFGAAVRIAGRTNLPANTGAAFYMALGTLSGGSAARIYIGDGSGWNLEFTARTASTDTVVGKISDTGSMSLNGSQGVNGATPPAQSTGWGAPIGGAVINNYNITDAGGANSNTNKAVAQIIAYLKLKGDFAA